MTPGARASCYLAWCPRPERGPFHKMFLDWGHFVLKFEIRETFSAGRPAERSAGHSRAAGWIVIVRYTTCRSTQEISRPASTILIRFLGRSFPTTHSQSHTEPWLPQIYCVTFTGLLLYPAPRYRPPGKAGCSALLRQGLLFYPAPRC